MGNNSYESLGCAQKSLKFEKTMGNNSYENLCCAQTPSVNPRAGRLVENLLNQRII